MRRSKRKGFAMMVLLAVMALIGAELLVLTMCAKIMILQTNTALLKACQKNIDASAMAWARMHISEAAQKPLSLDANSLASFRDIKSSITIAKAPDGNIEINTTCKRGERTLKHSLLLK